MGYRLDGEGSTPKMDREFLVPTLALGLTQTPTQWVLGALSLRVKQLGHEADH
jgi:hypothetical protein